MDQKNIELSIIILSFNTRDLTIACLRSLVASYTPRDRWEIIVVDNASSDGSVQAIDAYRKELSGTVFPIQLIENKTNCGFAAGNNCGIRVAQGKWILLLNSDTEVKGAVIQNTLALAATTPHVGAATARIQLSSGQIDPACHRGFPTPWAAFTYFLGLEKLFPHSRLFAQYHQGYKDISQPHEVDAITGAFFLFPKEVITRVGLLDERFFMYGEDLDFAYRIKKKGYHIWYFPVEGILHKKKQSGRASAKKELRKTIDRSFYETMILFYDTHYIQRYPWIVTTLIKCGIWCRMHMTLL